MINIYNSETSFYFNINIINNNNKIIYKTNLQLQK